jgi:hypothetical protein
MATCMISVQNSVSQSVWIVLKDVLIDCPSPYIETGACLSLGLEHINGQYYGSPAITLWADGQWNNTCARQRQILKIESIRKFTCPELGIDAGNCLISWGCAAIIPFHCNLGGYPLAVTSGERYGRQDAGKAKKCSLGLFGHFVGIVSNFVQLICEYSQDASKYCCPNTSFADEEEIPYFFRHLRNILLAGMAAACFVIR